MGDLTQLAAAAEYEEKEHVPELPVVFDRLVDIDDVGSAVAFIASKRVSGTVAYTEGKTLGLRYFRLFESNPVAAFVISTTNNFEERLSDEYLQVDFRFTGYSLAGLTPSDIEFAYKTLFGPYIEARDSVLAEGYDAYPVISDFSVYDSAKSKKRYACYSIEFPEKSGRLRRNVQIAL